MNNEKHCPEERQRSSKALETTKLQGGFMEAVLEFYWVPWTFSWQLSGGTDSSPLLASPQVTSISTACAVQLLGLDCVPDLVNLFTA